MDRYYQWVWDHHGSRYGWWVAACAYAVSLPLYLITAGAVVASQRATTPATYAAAAGVVAVGLLAVLAVMSVPMIGYLRLVNRWIAVQDMDPYPILVRSYSLTRAWTIEMVVVATLGSAMIAGATAAVADARGAALSEYVLWGSFVGLAAGLISVHSMIEAPMRPIRAALGAKGIGDELPRSRPSFATWSALTVLGASFAFANAAAMVAAIIGRVPHAPIVALAIAAVFTFAVALPITIGVGFAPSLRPIGELTKATDRVIAGDLSQRLPVVQDDDLGVLSASFNRMQAGLAERQRLQAAFGTYVDPDLAARLLEQGDDVFTGERREVTVMFIDIRDFTPFAEANSAEDTVSRLNALFEIVVPAVVDAGGHVNKFLGDGALVVFGAPNDLADHADAALRAAVTIERQVAQRFGDELRIGIGINTGPVIAGTIGGAGKLEFTLIGDTVNVAARVEQLTKTTGDTILLTLQCIDAMAAPPGLIDRGSHELKGKSAPVQVFGASPRIRQGH